MRMRSTWPAIVAGLLFVASACGGGATPSAGGGTPRATTGGAANPTSAATSGGGTVGRTGLKIGVVTDVGTLDDKNFNQFSYEGAQRGATAVQGTIQAIVTRAATDYAKNIQTFVDQRYDIIVTVGFALGNDTTIAAKANKNVQFIGVDQAVCVDEKGDPDPTFKCAGDAATLLPNYQGILFKEEQPGYLVGIIAASISKAKTIGAIGGTSAVPAVVKYMRGFENGAKSVDPNVQVKLAYVSAAPDDKAFNDPAGGRAFAQQFIQQNKVDVLFQVAGKTGNGVLQAACASRIHAIGVDVDQHQSTPEAAACIVTSAEKKLSNAVEQAILRVSNGTAKGGEVRNEAANEGVGISPYYEFQNLITPDIQAKVDAALARMKSGQLDACTPTPCTA